MAEKRHPGISMHKLPVGGDFVGLLFAVGSALIFVLGLPTLWYFVAFAGALGVAVAVFLKLVNRYRSRNDGPLSIFAAPSEAERTVSQGAAEARSPERSLPKLSLA